MAKKTLNQVLDQLQKLKRHAASALKLGSVEEDFRKAWRQGFIQAIGYRYQQRQVSGEEANSTALALLQSDYDKAKGSDLMSWGDKYVCDGSDGVAVGV